MVRADRDAGRGLSTTAVSAGERYRHHAPPGIRITTTSLAPRDAEKLAAAIAEVIHASTATYAG